jgi:AraC-like DNA-binding protein/CheY-like chemotaxis protein
MDSRTTIIVVAEEEVQAGYDHLALDSERVELVAPSHACEAIQCHLPDLVLLDCSIEADAGLRLLTELKHLCPGVPVIFITSQSSEKVVMAAFRAGAREYLYKPLNLMELRETIRKLLTLKRQTTDRRIAFTNGQHAAGVAGIGNMLTLDLPDRLLRAINYIEDHLADPLYLDEVAAVACLSKFHFCRQFKKYLGVTPIQFILNLRVYRAAILLRCTDLPVSSVAYRVGFSDLGEFYKQFRKTNGLTPQEYRNGGAPGKDPS